jgi:hypothetical protein
LYRRWHACSLDVLGTAQSSQPSDQEYHSRASCALTLTILCVADTFRPIARYVGKAQEESERLSDCGISIRRIASRSRWRVLDRELYQH